MSKEAQERIQGEVMEIELQILLINKSVWFRDDSPEEFKPKYSIYDSDKNKSSETPNRFNDTFGRATHYKIDEENFGDDIGDTSADGIPSEGDKKDIRLTWFSASKNKTHSNDLLFGPDSKKRAGRATVPNNFIERKPFATGSMKRAPSKTQTQYNYRTSDKGAKSSSVRRGNTTTSTIEDGMKALASHLKRYGELEMKEVQLRNKLWMNKNYNIEYAFKLLNPINGVVTLDNLHSVIRTNLEIPVVDREILRDIIQRLAYVKDDELVLSDMGFFEPTTEDESFDSYRYNVTRPQNAKDKSWHSTYSQMWKALLDTAKERRVIQNKMLKNHPRVVNDLFGKYRTRKMHR